MAVTLYTVQIAQWRLCKELGIPLLDTTFKSGLPQFAPDQAWVMSYKRNLMTQEEYTRLYTAKMRHSFREFHDRWEELKRYDTVAIACYCPPGCFCHRHLFLEMVRKYLELDGIGVTLGGEITQDTVQHILRALNHAESGTVTEPTDSASNIPSAFRAQ